MNIYDDDEEDGDLEFFRLLRAAFLKEEVRTVEEPDDRTPGQKVIDEIAATPTTLYLTVSSPQSCDGPKIVTECVRQPA